MLKIIQDGHKQSIQLSLKLALPRFGAMAHFSGGSVALKEIKLLSFFKAAPDFNFHQVSLA